MPFLEVEAIQKDYPDFSLDMSLCCDKGEIVAILGPSGGGKTTFLRILAGLIAPDRGSLRLESRDITGLPPRQRGVGLVFQDFALFPHYNVAGNLAYGLKNRHPRPRAQDIQALVETLLDRFSLSGFGQRTIAGLSGGERQRVALARALAVSPGLMLFDEPLGSLDATLRKELRGELRMLQRELGYTSISVTHDQEDALAVSDRVVVMRHGRIVQTGTPEELYARPRTAFVASFFGDSNLFSGQDLGLGEGLFFIRAEQVRLLGSAEATHELGRVLELTVVDFEYRGRDYLVKGQSASAGGVTCCFRSVERPKLGDRVKAGLPREALLPIADDREPPMG
jgi:ABC-type Fe3+/spermidine/putrescine transport system ATPase subunit